MVVRAVGSGRVAAAMGGEGVVAAEGIGMIATSVRSGRVVAEVGI